MKLSDYRQKSELTYDELAGRLRLSKSTAWRICNGETTDAATAAQISAATKGAVTIEELLYPDGVPRGAVVAAHVDRELATQWGQLANGAPPAPRSIGDQEAA